MSPRQEGPLPELSWDRSGEHVNPRDPRVKIDAGIDFGACS